MWVRLFGGALALPVVQKTPGMYACGKDRRGDTGTVRSIDDGRPDDVGPQGLAAEYCGERFRSVDRLRNSIDEIFPGSRDRVGTDCEVTSYDGARGWE